MTKHVMMIERGGGKRKKGKVKGSKKSSPVSRKLKAIERQVWDVLGGIGCIVVIVWIIQFIIGGK